MNRNILPECHVDTLLISMIGYKDVSSHQPNIGDVINTMKKRFTNGKAIGVIDDDKNKPNYVDEFKLQDSENNLKLLVHSEKKHYLIVVYPDCENWIFNVANDLGIDPAVYKIRNLKYFKQLTKSSKVDQNDNVKSFINTIKQKKNSPINTFIKWINQINGI